MGTGHQMELPPPAVLMQIINGKSFAIGLTLAADLGVADILSDGPKGIEDLASATSTHRDSLYRVLRMMTGAGIFKELPDGSFENTPASDFLRSDHPASMKGVAQWAGHPINWNMWGDIDHSVKTGETVISKTYPDKDVFEVLSGDEKLAQVFNSAMTGWSNMEGQPIVSGYDFSVFASLIDVGGGHGALAAAIKSQSPATRVTVFDMPHVIAGSREQLSQMGLESEAGDFFESIPGGYDACLMKHIIHDWDEASAVKILSAARGAINEGGKVLLCELIVSDGPEGVAAKVLDIEMLVGPGGRERTEAEYRALLAKAELKLTRIVRTQAPIAIIEAERM